MKHLKWLKAKRLLPTKANHMLELQKMRLKKQGLNLLYLFKCKKEQRLLRNTQIIFHLRK